MRRGGRRRRGGGGPGERRPQDGSPQRRSRLHRLAHSTLRDVEALGSRPRRRGCSRPFASRSAGGDVQARRRLTWEPPGESNGETKCVTCTLPIPGAARGKPGEPHRLRALACFDGTGRRRSGCPSHECHALSHRLGALASVTARRLVTVRRLDPASVPRRRGPGISWAVRRRRHSAFPTRPQRLGVPANA